jgi:thiol-disulfide isomerase/thioredoxin
MTLITTTVAAVVAMLVFPAAAEEPDASRNAPATMPAKAFGPALVGQPAPQFTATTLDGQKVNLADEKGNVVLMDFWATWCGPCRKSLPHVQAMSTDPELRSRGLKVWAVNCTRLGKETEEKARDYVKNEGFTFTVPLDAEGLATKNFGINLIPVTLIVGRDGVVRDMIVGFGEQTPEKIRQAVQSALDQPPP